eukprot:scaffold25999_cov15-Prasinocladus_malaysianus.AAC.1
MPTCRTKYCGVTASRRHGVTRLAMIPAIFGCVVAMLQALANAVSRQSSSGKSAADGVEVTIVEVRNTLLHVLTIKLTDTATATRN